MKALNPLVIQRKKISYQKTDFDEFAQEIQAYLDENDLGNRRTVEFL